MSCHCVEEVDLDVFRGVFVEQWLKGRRHTSCQEALFFCTTCGPPAVQESLKGSSHSNGGSHKRTNTLGSAGGSPNPEKKSQSSKPNSLITKLKMLLTPSKNGSKSDLTSMSSKHGSSAQAPEHGMRIMSAEEEELPTTPRTEKELYLCVTCGSCYCRDHACDHHYSRQERNTLGSVAGEDTDVPDRGYPYHSFFIGVPSFVSTHPSHLLPETSWGLLFPTVTVREIEEGTVDISKPLPFYEHFEEICDASATTVNLNGSMSANNHSFSRSKNALGVSSAAHTRVLSTYGSSGRLDETPLAHQKTNSYVDSRDDRLQRGPELLTPVGAHAVLSLPEYHASPPGNWSYLMFCAKCADRQAVRLQGKQCDNDVSRQVHLRRLGQLTALLAYFLLRGVRLEVPPQYLNYSAKKLAQQVERQRQQQQQRSIRTGESQRVGRASEFVGGLETSATHASTSNTCGGGVGTSPTAMALASGFCLLSRSETDHVITRAAICGFSNTSYFCYMNSVLQCVMRCRIFASPLLRLDPAHTPGKLTRAASRLIQHAANQTYQDVRNGAVYAFVHSLRAQICSINCLFEEDEQQDAQEFLITLLNGIADEFDKGKTDAEKKATRRVSFEGTLLSEVTCSQCKHCAPRNEMFMSLSIPIEKSIEAGLASLFTPTTLRGKDRYACESCFKKLSVKDQQAHNALAASQAVAEKKAKAEGKSLSKEAKEERVYANSVYSEAEVRTSLSHLGGSLAIHLLRFHHDPEAQDTIKLVAPVGISLTLDLTPYVSPSVLESYKNTEKIHVLQRRFPGVSAQLLNKYLRCADSDVRVATRKMLDDGHGMAGAAHSRQLSPGAAGSADEDKSNDAAVAASNASDDVAGVGSNAADNAGGTSPTCTSPPKVKRSAPATATRSGKFEKSATARGGGKLAAEAAAPLSATALCAITKEEFDPFGERAPPTPSLVRRLVGIVVHRGSLHGGHYIAYVRHATRPHVWFRCDDEDIDIVEEKYVLDHEAEVYLAFYE